MRCSLMFYALYLYRQTSTIYFLRQKCRCWKVQTCTFQKHYRLLVVYLWQMLVFGRNVGSKNIRIRRREVRHSLCTIIWIMVRLSAISSNCLALIARFLPSIFPFWFSLQLNTFVLHPLTWINSLPASQYLSLPLLQLLPIRTAKR